MNTEEKDHIIHRPYEPDQQKGMPINIPRGPIINVPQPSQPVEPPTPPPSSDK